MTKWPVAMMLFLTLSLSMILPALSNDQPHVWYRDQVAVLMYHHIHDSDKSSATITGELFTRQLEYLRNKGYTFITLEQFQDYMNGSPVPDNAVLVTFDDGYESFYENAYPVLKRLRIPAVNFVITQYLDHPPSGGIPYLSREQIRRMKQESDFFDFQCHTHALHDKTPEGGALLTTPLKKGNRLETEEEFRRRILNDTAACMNILAPLNSGPVHSLAYPFGIYTEKTADLLHEAGILHAFTTDPGMSTRSTNAGKIPRINAGSPWIAPERLHYSITLRASAF